ncbi:MAG: dNTP triphosphohydrolase [Proteobacteria bacterium]|nr:dNTP triphosphohydrolase [Pseudomonadota bacterium]
MFQHDYDRLLFSTPVRRLADKTQVWPMDENDSVRTRLTHSHEVANLARSIGTRVFLSNREHFERSLVGAEALVNVIHPLLSAAGLGHDLGNPPFGHQGEAAIGNWFKRNDWVFSKVTARGPALSKAEQIPKKFQLEFTKFDGNPQALRLLTKLQTHIDGVGLDLSAATLASGLKYPVSFANADDNVPTKKKGGYFSSEKHVVAWVREATGLAEGQRHPLTWIMEACDDIAYSVLDVDDVLKKGVMSPDDVLVNLRRNLPKDPCVIKIRDRFDSVETKTLRPEAQRDIKIQYLRAFLIEALVTHASQEFDNNADAIFSFRHLDPLMDNNRLCESLKRIAKTYAFNNSDVLKTEALGAAALSDLMSAFWIAISDRTDFGNIESRRKTASAKYIFSLISPNYIEQAASDSLARSPGMGVRYRELRLLTDMVSGMTDTFAIKLWTNLKAIPHAYGT